MTWLSVALSSPHQFGGTPYRNAWLLTDIGERLLRQRN
jgi:hypothetical protein